MKKIKVDGKTLNIEDAVEAAKIFNNDKILCCHQLIEKAQGEFSKLKDTTPTDLDKLHEQKIAYLTDMYFKLVKANKRQTISQGKVEKEVKRSIFSKNFDEFTSNLESMIKDAKNVSDYSAKVTYQSVVDVASGVAEILEERNRQLDEISSENKGEMAL